MNLRSNKNTQIKNKSLNTNRIRRVFIAIGSLTLLISAVGFMNEKYSPLFSYFYSREEEKIDNHQIKIAKEFLNNYRKIQDNAQKGEFPSIEIDKKSSGEEIAKVQAEMKSGEYFNPVTSALEGIINAAEKEITNKSIADVNEASVYGGIVSIFIIGFSLVFGRFIKRH